MSESLEKQAQGAVPQVQEPQPMEVGRRPLTAQTDEEARSEAVGEVLRTAYNQASQLKLTPSESKELLLPFRDDQVRGGAKGEDELLYVCHIHLSDRLNAVLGIGQWCLVKRSQRAEPYISVKSQPGVRIYYEGVMLIRGAFVTEAIGSGTYHKNNPKEDFGSAIEIAMSDCLSRCCKRLGIGSQCWDKGYCESWLARYSRQRPPIPMPTPKVAQEPPPEAQPAEPQPAKRGRPAKAPFSQPDFQREYQNAPAPKEETKYTQPDAVELYLRELGDNITEDELDDYLEKANISKGIQFIPITMMDQLWKRIAEVRTGVLFARGEKASQ